MKARSLFAQSGIRPPLRRNIFRTSGRKRILFNYALCVGFGLLLSRTARADFPVIQTASNESEEIIGS